MNVKGRETTFESSLCLVPQLHSTELKTELKKREQCQEPLKNRRASLKPISEFSFFDFSQFLTSRHPFIQVAQSEGYTRIELATHKLDRGRKKLDSLRKRNNYKRLTSQNFL